MKIADNIYEIIDSVGDATIVAATKYVDSSLMKELLKYGINNFGENRVDSFLEKYEDLKNEDIVWHFIGHLQRNKALKVIDKIEYLHSLDSLKLAKIINDNRKEPLKCFIEVNLNKEESKDGIYLDELDDFIINVIVNVEMIITYISIFCCSFIVYFNVIKLKILIIFVTFELPLNYFLFFQQILLILYFVNFFLLDTKKI